ncbi:MAG: mechanosensitive ion channel family protein [Leptospirillum sp.]
MPFSPPPEQTWTHSLVTLALSLLAGAVLHTIVFAFLRRKTEKSPPSVSPPPLETVRWPSFFLSMEIVLLILHPATPFPGVFEELLSRILVLLTILTVAWTLITLTRFLGNQLLSRHLSGPEDDLAFRKVRTRVLLIERLLNVLIILISAATALMTVPRIRTIGESLLASAGIAGIVIGLAARPLLTNVIAGIQIALTQPIRIDDVVIVDNEWGWIEEIGIAYVVVRIWDLRRLILPLSYFIEQPFENWTYKSSQLLGYVHIYADYSVDVRDLREHLKTLLESTPLWDRMAWNLQVTQLDEKAVQMRALFSARDSGSRWDLSVYVREGMLAYLRDREASGLPRVRVEIAPQPSRSGSATTGEGQLSPGKSPEVRG